MTRFVERLLLLCYVDHHDAAYRWAERRKIERHPATGAAQLVEIRETVREIEVPRYVETATPVTTASKPLLFAGVAEEVLLRYGVPAEWLADVRAATEDTLFEITDHLPAEAAEALVEVATGGMPQPRMQTASGGDPFAHPDAQRRFRLMTNAEELEQALAFPWDKWTVFLHPAQRDVVERSFNGPARVAGSAGTGKTIVAIHRAAHLARVHPDATVLLTTLGDPLAHALAHRLDRLLGRDTEIRGRISVSAIDAVGVAVHESAAGPVRLADAKTIRETLHAAADAGGPLRFGRRFLETEWHEVVDAWQLDSWEAYRDVARLGRKTRLAEPQRAQLWAVFERVRESLRDRGLLTMAGVFTAATRAVATGARCPFDFAVVDEAQDLGVPQLRFLAALAGGRADGLFFAGDLGQRIFQTPYSWKSLGVDVRGRSQTLRINYRTSHQIRVCADRLLPLELRDVDGNAEVRRGTISAFHGAEPELAIEDDADAEAQAVGRWIAARGAEGIAPHEIAIFVRSAAELGRAEAAAAAAGLPCAPLDGRADGALGYLAIGTMHLAKGLEFRAVIVMACDEEVVPLQSRIEAVGDDADLEDVYETERHLLYVACTRARDHLLVTAVSPASEFLDDLRER
jgi:superfamily I DNA/RNA helicase